MLILAPMHPVMLVFDLDQTTGRALPSEIENFAKFEGETKEEQGFWWTSEILEEPAGTRGLMTGFGSNSRSSPQQTPASRPLFMATRSQR